MISPVFPPFQELFSTTRRKLLQKSLQPSTHANYHSKLRFWRDFCAEADHRDETFLNAKIAENFVCWMYDNTGDAFSGKYIDEILTAIISEVNYYGCDFYRGQVLTKMLRGYAKQRPRIQKLRKPWTLYHNLLMWKHITDRSDLDSMIKGAGIMLGWGGLLRPGEIAKKSKAFRLNRHQIRFEPSGRWDALRDVVLTWRSSKMNPHQKLEIIYISCLCNQLFCGMRVICPAHWILATTQMVDARWGNKHPQRPLLKKANGKVLNYYDLRKYMTFCITSFNKRVPILRKRPLDPADYTPHALRIGGCVDRARNGDAGHMIEKAGRWNSLCWKSCYLNMDWRDLIKLSGRSTRDLQQSCVTPFTVSAVVTQQRSRKTRKGI